MFGDFMGMMGKLKEAQKRVEETKKRLDTVLLEEASNDGKLKVSITANRKITALDIDDALLGDKEQLEDYLVVILNKAIEKANGVYQTKMSAAAKDGLPNIPGVDSFFKP